MSKLGKTKEQVIDTGFRAKLLREDPTFGEAVSDLEEKWTLAWKKETDPAKREALWALVHALEGVQSELYVMQSDGEIEASASKRISTR